jgi:hypothetical protein
MKILTKIALFLSLIVMQFGCKSNQSPTIAITPPVQSTPFISLKNGNHWEYVDSIFYSPDTITAIRYSWAIIGTQKILSGADSVEVSILHYTRNDTSGYDYFYKNNPEGLTQYSPAEFEAGGHYGVRSLLLKFPMQLGDAWDAKYDDYTEHRSCLSSDTLIPTSFGIFHSYVVRRGPGNPWYINEYYREDLGLIGAYSQSKNGSSTVVQKTTLLSYELK